MKTAKTRKPMRLYIPEQAMSTEKFIVVVSGRMTCIVGVPYSAVSVAGILKNCTMAVEASLLYTLSAAPTL